MELNHLKYFYVVARERGFTRAAKVLRVQQPGISKVVKQLEEDLGVVLLERLKREVRLTQAGEEIFLYCRDIFSSVEAIERLAEKNQDECQGPMRLGMSDSIASHLLPEILAKFLQKNSRVKPAIFTGTSQSICTELREGRIDFGLFFTVPEGDYEVKELDAVSFRLVVAAKHAKDPQVLSSFIGSRSVDYPQIRSFPVVEMLKANRLPAEMQITCNNLDTHLQMVRRGLGVALLPSFMVKEDLAKKYLRILYPDRRFEYRMKLVMRKTGGLSHNSVVFIEAFRKSLSKML